MNNKTLKNNDDYFNKVADNENPESYDELYNYTNKATKIVKENKDVLLFYYQYIKNSVPNQVKEEKYEKSELIYNEKLKTVFHLVLLYYYRLMHLHIFIDVEVEQKMKQLL